MKEEIVKKALQEHVPIARLAKEYGISRPTIYKWIERFNEYGVDGLVELSRRPHSAPNRTTDEHMELILNIRNKHKAWGGRKLRQRLLNTGYQDLPAEVTFNRILKKNGQIEPLESEKRQPFIRFEKDKPNELWQMDFKGHFKMGSVRCHPLTVLDDHSRFSITLKACLAETHDAVHSALMNAFQEYGLPDAMTMDNGSPWKGSPPWTLSRLTVWLMRLGIKVSHSSVRHPQTQGKDERFHRTLKEEVLKYHTFRNLKQTQEILDHWRTVYNYERPHEGIGLLCPAQRYMPSSKPYVRKLPKIEYPPEDIVRKVHFNGNISYLNKQYFVGEHLRGEYVAIRQSSKEDVASIYFVNTNIANIGLRNK